MSLLPELNSPRSLESTSKPKSLIGFTRVMRRQRSHSFDDKDIFQEGNSDDNRFIAPPISPPKDTSCLTPAFQSNKKASTNNIIQRLQSKSFDDNDVPCGNNISCHSSPSRETDSKSSRRLLHRSESKDDICVGISTSSLLDKDVIYPRLPNQSSFTNKSLSRDNSNSPVLCRAERSFVRIYTGLKTFTPRNETVAVAIFFEPLSLVYEIVILDLLDEAEVRRLYVFQGEIIFQLRQRKTSTALKAENSKNSLKNSPQMGLVNRKKSRRYNNQSELKSMVSKWQMNNDTEKDDTQEIDLDTIDIRSLNRTSVQPLMFAKIIMKCLRSQRQRNVSRYCLVNDMIAKNFTCFSHIPEDMKKVIPSTIDAKDLIVKAKSISAVKESTSTLKKSLDNVDEVVDACRELPVIEHHYCQQNTRNPNQLKWRLKWQFAIAAVIKENKARKQIRSGWGDLISLAYEEKKDKAEAEAKIHHRDDVDFRKLRVKTRRIGINSEMNRDGDLTQSVATLANQYKTEMQARRKLKSEKSGKRF